MSKTLLEKLAKILEYRRSPIYNDQRAKKLKARLAHFTEEEMTLAARTLAENPFMMGDNPNGVKYATVDYLIRGDDIVEKWLEMADLATTNDIGGLEF